MKEWFWSGKPWQAFKNVAIILSFTLNIVLLIFLTLAAAFIIPAVNEIAEPLVGELHQSFVDMSDAHIVRTIEVDDSIPVVFDLPVQTETIATLTQPVPMTLPTTMVLPGGGGVINGTVTLELPAGSQLPVQFDIMVPVSQTVPVSLAVAVDIPLEETELNEPFGRHQALFAPLDLFLTGLPSSNAELIDRLNENAAPEEGGEAVEQADTR